MKRSDHECLPGSRSVPACDATTCEPRRLPNKPLERTGFAGRSAPPFGRRHFQPMTCGRRHLRPGIGVWIASVCVVTYFGLSLVPRALPGLGGTGLSFAYAVSLPIVVLLLLAVGVWGGVGLLRAWVRGRAPWPRHGAYLSVGCVALASFTLALGLARALPRPLPTGSDLQRFDRAVWQNPRSARYVPGDVTPRQKMLADVVKSVLPGHTRAELEKVLGPSLVAPWYVAHREAVALGQIPGGHVG